MEIAARSGGSGTFPRILPVQFVAKTTSMMLNDFAEERLLIYANLPLPANIEILKRNTQQVGTMNISEGFRARCQ